MRWIGSYPTSLDSALDSLQDSACIPATPFYVLFLLFKMANGQLAIGSAACCRDWENSDLKQDKFIILQFWSLTVVTGLKSRCPQGCGPS